MSERTPAVQTVTADVNCVVCRPLVCIGHDGVCEMYDGLGTKLILAPPGRTSYLLDTNGNTYPVPLDGCKRLVLLRNRMLTKASDDLKASHPEIPVTLEAVIKSLTACNPKTATATAHGHDTKTPSAPKNAVCAD